MSQAKTYHVIIRKPENHQGVHEHLIEIAATNLSTWAALPCIITCDLTEQQVAWLRTDFRILEIQRNQQRSHAEIEPAFNNYNWGRDRVDSRSGIMDRKISTTATGEGVDVYVMDAGVLFNHVELTGRCRQHPSTAFDGYRDFSDPHYAMPDPTRYMGADGRFRADSHGLHTAALISGDNVGVAPKSYVIPVRVFTGGVTDDRVLLHAMSWIIDTRASRGRPSVVNMSYAKPGFNLVDRLIVSTLVAAGCVVVVAAGNDARDAAEYSPAGVGMVKQISNTNGMITAAYELAGDTSKPITVGATARAMNRTLDAVDVRNPLANVFTDALAEYTNFGPAVDVFAPGSNLNSARLVTTGDLATAGHTDYPVGDQYGTQSGTSGAAAVVSGVCALYLEMEPTLGHDAVRQRVIQRSTVGALFSTERTNSLLTRFDYGVPVWLDLNRTNSTDPILRSENRIAYSWFQPTTVAWASEDDQFVIRMDESSTLQRELTAVCRNSQGENERLHYRLEVIPPVGDSAGTAVPSWVQLRENSDSALSPGIIGHNHAVLIINSPSVDVDITDLRFRIVAYTAYVDPNNRDPADEGLRHTHRDISLTVVNQPNKPKWSLPQSNYLTKWIFGTDTLEPGAIINTFNEELATFLAKDPDYYPDNSRVTYRILPGVHKLPPGLEAAEVNGTLKLTGRVGIIPKNITSDTYRFIIRASKPGRAGEPDLIADRVFQFENVVPSNLKHAFAKQWLSSLPVDSIGGATVYQLDSIALDTTENVQIQMDNPDMDPLITVIGVIPGVVDSSTVFNGRLPTGVSIDSSMRLSGIVSATNVEGKYYFSVMAADGYDVDTGEYNHAVTENFYIEVRGSSSDPGKITETIVWDTSEGPLGHVWESYPCHLGITAHSSSNNDVTYTVVGGVLPLGYELEASTGLIRGTSFFVDGDTEYTIVVRAQSATNYSDRRFTLVIRELYNTEDVVGARVTVTGRLHSEVASWAYATAAIPQEMVFRYTDPAFGRVKNPVMYMVAGLHAISQDALIEKLRDYHQQTELRLGNVKSAQARDPSGRYVYDVVYFEVVDPLNGAGGFDSKGKEVAVRLPEGSRALPRIRSMNLQSGGTQFFPNSLNNMRQDLIQTSDRLARLNVIEPYNPDVEGGVGVAGNEGFPLWMSCEQTPGRPSSRLGFQPALVIAYVTPGSGPLAVTSLRVSGVVEEMSGKVFTLDRYLIDTYREVTTIFDNGSTRFVDVIDDQYEDITINSEIVFDRSTRTTSKYFKFPPGDK